MSPLQICASIVLGNPNWVWPAVGAGAVFLAILLGAYGRSMQPVAWRAGLLLLKGTAILLLALCLVNPLLSRSRVKPGENIVILLADRSASMQIGSGGGHSRGAEFQQLLTDPDSPWLTRLQQDFDVRRYTFGDSLKLVESFQGRDFGLAEQPPATAEEPRGEGGTPHSRGMTFDAPASRMWSSLATLHQRFERQPLAAILLFSDGNATDHRTTIQGGESRPGTTSAGEFGSVPVFPVLLREEGRTVPDLSIRNVAVSQTAFEDTPVSVQATIGVTGPIEGNVVCTLAPSPNDDESRVQRVVLPAKGEEPLTARFLTRPAQGGVLFYELLVYLESEPDVVHNPRTTQEATFANNRQLITVDRGSGVPRILYVGGRPNWEHKFLNRAIAEDERIQMVSLVRIARKEAKFDFRGRAGESTNPLFRGFKSETDEETEAYDDPVLIRLNTRDGEELSDGFPKTKEQLYRYEAIILDDIEGAFFTQDQLVLLDRFVSERGGGLMMLGGPESFRHGDWQKTPLRDALPLYLDRTGQTDARRLLWRLSREGWLEPWMRLRETEDQERMRLESMPEFSIFHPLSETKPGASILAEVEDQSGRRWPALVAQSYGRGRSVAVLIGDLWRWSLRRESEAEDELAKAWRQTVRWLTSDVPSRVDGGTTWTTLGESPALRIGIRVRDAEYQPQENAAVKVSIEQPDGQIIDLEPEPSLRETGLFETDYVPRLSGPYRARIQVLDDRGLPERSTEIGWTSNPDADEFAQTTVNRPALEELATSTGGEVVPVDQLDDFVARLPYRHMPITEMETSPLWHTPWLLLMSLGCLAAEWGLRRWKGLP